MNKKIIGLTLANLLAISGCKQDQNIEKIVAQEDVKKYEFTRVGRVDPKEFEKAGDEYDFTGDSVPDKIEVDPEGNVFIWKGIKADFPGLEKMVVVSYMFYDFLTKFDPYTSVRVADNGNLITKNRYEVAIYVRK